MKRIFGLLMLLLVMSMPSIASAGEVVTAKVLDVGQGSRLEGTLTLRGLGTSSAGVKVVELYVGETRVARVEPEGHRESVEATYIWDTTRLPSSGSPSYNGTYRIKARAVAAGGVEDTASVEVNVSNAPAAPSGVNVDVHQHDVTVVWNANFEPDIIGYVIERDSGGGFAVIAEVRSEGRTFWESVDDGTYSYRVSAVRPSGMADGTSRTSAPSAPVSATVGRPAAQEPPPGTEPSSGGGDKGSGGGGRHGKAGTGSGWQRAASGSSASVRRLVGASGLPFAPGGRSSAALPNLPMGQAPEEWGTYEKNLPYSPPPQVRAPVQVEPLGERETFPVVAVIQGSGLKWVAAGALMIALATLLWVFSSRPALVALLKPRLTRFRRLVQAEPGVTPSS